MPKVQILLSTYNGEKYLSQQIESILAQDYSNISLLIRDDGSSDKTLDILERFQNTCCNNIKVYSGSNVGACNSYFDLLFHADLSCEYYAFCDQDDWWLSNKISSAIKILEGSDKKYRLYCGTTKLVDKDLNPINQTVNKKKRPSFGNALIENIACGCTMVFSQEVLSLIRSSSMPQRAFMHDWWIYLVASLYGDVIIDYNQYILYRQHNSNEIGNATNFIEKMKRRINSSKKLKTVVREQALNFLELYDVPADKKKMIYEIVESSASQKFKLLFDSRIYRQKRLDTFVYKMFMMI